MAKNPLPPWATITNLSAVAHIERLVKNKATSWDHVYLTRVDSDDLLGSNVKKNVLAAPPHYRTLNFNTGFLYDTRSRIITAYQHPSPPFYTDIYSKQELLTGKYPRRKGGHNYLLPGGLKILPAFQFCVVCHHGAFQDSSTWGKLRRSSQTRLQTASLSLQQRVSQELRRPWNSLEALGCPHLKVSTSDKLAIYALGCALGHASGFRLGRTPVIRRSRFSPPGVHGGGKQLPMPAKRAKVKPSPQPPTRKRAPKTAKKTPAIRRAGRPKIPSMRAGRPKVPSIRHTRNVPLPIRVRRKTPQITTNSKRGKDITKAQKRLQSPFNSRLNTKRRLQKGQRTERRIGYKLLKQQHPNST